MSSLPTTPAPVPGARAAGWTAVVAGLLESGLGVAAWVETATYAGESSTAAIGFVVALLVGVPGALALLLGGLGIVLARSALGLPAAVLGVVCAAGPVVLWLGMWVPWL